MLEPGRPGLDLPAALSNFGSLSRGKNVVLQGRF